MANVINLAEAAKPEFTEREEQFAGELIGMGLTRLTIIALALGKDAASLNPSEVKAGMCMINRHYKVLGHTIMDARRAQSPFMQQAVRAAARGHRIRVKIA